MEIHCPNCKRKVGYFVVGDYRYGSPLKTCQKCKTEYINPAYHEIEIDGISPDAFDMKKLLIGILFSVGFFAIAAAIHYFEMNTRNYYHTSPIAIMVISTIVFFYALINVFLVKTGIKAKWTERKKQESANRLTNHEYAVKLREQGYNVPEKYLPQEYAENNEQ